MTRFRGNRESAFSLSNLDAFLAMLKQADLRKQLGGMAAKDIEEEKRGSGASFLKRLGPGLITGASDDDPSGIGTYSQAGA